MADERRPSDPPSVGEGSIRGNGGVESVFNQLVNEVSREDVQETLGSFEEKLERMKERPTVKRIGRGLNRARLFYKMLRAWWNDQFALPWRTVAALTAALIYFINPMDMVPDFVFLGGLLDDATVLYLCYKWVETDLWNFVEAYDLDPVRYGLKDEAPPSEPETTGSS